MAPFHTAIEVQLIRQTDGELVYSGNLDPEWRIASVPHGGYVLGLVVEACIKAQSRTEHRDPLHVTAHYLHAAQVGSCNIRVTVLKKGRGFTNILADLIQDGIVKITTHQIFGVLSSTTAGSSRYVIEPPSPFARRLPLHEHPSKPSKETYDVPVFEFVRRMRFAVDEKTVASNKNDHPDRTNSETVGGGGTKWGCWAEMHNERITPPLLCFLGDIPPNLPYILPEGDPNRNVKSWFPTLTLTIEFLFPISPTTDLRNAAHTVGLYSTATFLTEPSGRHDCRVEIWTAPSDIDKGEAQTGWRDNQRCLAVVNQMALTIPLAVNHRNAKTKL